jgi:hypothetical protein
MKSSKKDPAKKKATAARPPTKKPELNVDRALSFAEADPSKDRQVPPPLPDRTGRVPEGDARLTVNIRKDLHERLKVAAFRRRTTIGAMIEEWVASTLPDEGR